MNRWYVLQVTSGKELDIQQELTRRGVKSLVPVENRIIRQHGKWKTKSYIVFQGYVFVEILYSFGLYYIISGINGVIKILGGGNAPTALTDEEVKRIGLLDMLLKTPSEVTFDKKGKFIPLNGVLKEFKNHIISVKKRYKRAAISLPFAGTETEITVSFTERQTQENTEG